MNKIMATKILLIVALVCFVLAAFGVSFAHVALVPLGLAFFIGSKLT
jgi:Sec-independent protein secretion pathway component TatC